MISDPLYDYVTTTDGVKIGGRRTSVKVALGQGRLGVFVGGDARCVLCAARKRPDSRRETL